MCTFIYIHIYIYIYIYYWVDQGILPPGNAESHRSKVFAACGRHLLSKVQSPVSQTRRANPYSEPRGCRRRLGRPACKQNGLALQVACGVACIRTWVGDGCHIGTPTGCCRMLNAPYICGSLFSTRPTRTPKSHQSKTSSGSLPPGGDPQLARISLPPAIAPDLSDF